MKATGVGSISIFPIYGGKVELTNVHYVPNSRYSLVSVGAITQKGCIVTFDGSTYLVSDKLGIIFKGSRRGNGYIIF